MLYLDPTLNDGESPSIEAASSNSTGLSRCHKSRSFEYGDVLQEGRQCDFERFSQFADGCLTMTKLLNNRTARRVRGIRCMGYRGLLVPRLACLGALNATLQVYAVRHGEIDEGADIRFHRTVQLKHESQLSRI